MLLSFIALFFKSGASSTPDRTSPSVPVANGSLTRTTAILIFGGMFLGFAIKVPMFPLHTWLPDAHTQAPLSAR